MTEPSDSIQRGREALQAWERTRPRNFFEVDTNLQQALRYYLGEDFEVHQPMLTRCGALSATRVDELARRSNEDDALPRLERYDSFGEHTEQVVFHPSYHDLGALIWSTAVLAVLGQPGNGLLSGALAYLLSHNGEAGHICPVACTAGLIRLLQRVGSEQQREQFLPQLLHTDYNRRLHASQFVTEVQGGSDVGANHCQAEPDEQTGLYRISGEKWFCSVADAQLFVVTARPTGAAAGTRGLGLFLVPREVNGKVNNFELQRLKTKLGTRSLATGEMIFDGALAEPIGELGDGFKNLISVVLDTSRCYNALAACGMMRRAYLDAWTYAQSRQAFGQPISGFAPVQETLARMKVMGQAGLAASLRVLQLTDRVDTFEPAEPAEGEQPQEPQDELEGLAAARRIHVMLNKYWTATLCSQVVRMGVELFGGNGTVEDFSVLPRLYRDTAVLENWEGTHNTLIAQVLRDFSQRQLHLFWIEELRETLEGVTLPQLTPHRQRAAEMLEQLGARIQQLLAGDPTEASLQFRHVVDRMCDLCGFVAMVRELNWEADQGMDTGKPQVVDLYHHLYLDRQDPADIKDYGALVRAICAR